MIALYNWVTSHALIVTALGGPVVISVIDLVWALNPNLKSNGILHAVYDYLKPKPAVQAVK